MRCSFSVHTLPFKKPIPLRNKNKLFGRIILNAKGGGAA
jgi:hypothetical protein